MSFASLRVFIASGILFLGCAKPHSAAYLAKKSGDNQLGVASNPLPQPLIVQTTDMAGNPSAGVTVAWSVVDGDGKLSSATSVTGDDGTAAITATLGPTAMSAHFSATTFGLFGSPVIFEASRTPFKLAYSDPANGGKLRLVKNSDSNDNAVTLDFVVAGTPLTGYSTGFNLPLDDSKVALDAMVPMKPGMALNPGMDPIAALAALPSSGPLKGVLTSALSQKASGAGAVTTDSMLPANAVLYSLKLTLLPTATPGPVFDGTASGFTLPSGGLRDRQGTQVVNANEVAIGKLEVVK